MSDKYCVDCMNFLTVTLYKGRVPDRFKTTKILNALNKNNRIVIFWCRKSGAFYLNTHRIYYLKACDGIE